MKHAQTGFHDLGDTRLDTDRERRCGFPEVVFAEGKTAETLLNIFSIFESDGIDGFATRVAPEKGKALLARFSKGRYNEIGRTFRLPQETKERTRKKKSGKVAIVTAGTSDLPVAEEAKETSLWTGAATVLIQDVGVAGPHRLQAVLPEIVDSDAVVVVAGMEGALPSVVGGFVSCPVVAVPTSIGYGASFGGLAALLGMLNSCASNVTVVNIDAGFKAGYVAGLIAKRAHR